jgi:outer membrane protein OmpA-like peptidoglycan-associated protein
MKNKTIVPKRNGYLHALNQTLQGLVLGILIFIGANATLQAQEVAKEYSKPSWYFGLAGGANFNFYDGSTQQLTASFTPPVVFHKGNGVGLFLAPSIEYYKPDTRFGFILQAGLDSRRGDFDLQLTDCNCPAGASTDLNYITIEPSLRFAPFKSAFYLYGGPRIAFNIDKAFTYRQGINPAFPNQIAPENVTGDLSNVENTIISMQIGAGYDIPLSKANTKTQLVLSPFVSFHPYFGQNPRSIETWNVTTVRTGLVLKIGSGHEILPVEEEIVKIIIPQVEFSVHAPINIPGEILVTETFPLRNYIYFDEKSTEISKRYVLLDKNQVLDFKEDQVEIFAPNTALVGRSKREMTVYYNVLNILGNRMQENPNSNITLVGTSENGVKDGEKMAASVKDYLVTIFRINSSRIAIKGQMKASTIVKTKHNEKELELLEEENRRVSVQSSSPVLLMEFQSGPNAPLKAVQITAIQEEPISSFVVFNVDGADEAFNTWKLELTDSKGNVQYYGPFMDEEAKISGNAILGSNLEGDYKVKMIGTSKTGENVTKETNAHIIAWTPSKVEEGMRFSIIYEFDDAKAIAMYHKYLSEVVVPKIPANSIVRIQGHTDTIGEVNYNQKLSLSRANDVHEILQNSVSKLGTTNVKFEIIAFGENENSAPFGNNSPEERSYNRTVIIDVISAKK